MKSHKELTAALSEREAEVFTATGLAVMMVIASVCKTDADTDACMKAICSVAGAAIATELAEGGEAKAAELRHWVEASAAAGAASGKVLS